MEPIIDKINLSSAKLKYWLQLNDLPQPSFNPSAPSRTLPPSAPLDVHRARQDLIDASWQLHQLVLGPSEYLLTMTANLQHASSLQWLCRFGVFAAIPLSGSISYPSLATAISAPESTLKSVARMVMTSGMLREPSPNHVAHTASSLLLATDQNFRLWAEFLTDTSAPTMARFADATARWPGSTDKTETAYGLAFDTRLPFFDHLATLPRRTEQFAGYMRSVAASEGTDLHHLLSNYDWAGLGDALVVDIGGSTGHASIALARAFPRLRLVVQDLAANVATGAAELPADLAERVRFVAHDFFEVQPERSADVYLLRMILHDWADADARAILQRVVEAMRPSSRLVVMDTALPEPGTLGWAEERVLRSRDLVMRQAFSAKERSMEDWATLMAEVGGRLRLKLKGCMKGPGSALAVIAWEAEEAEEEVVKGPPMEELVVSGGEENVQVVVMPASPQAEVGGLEGSEEGAEEGAEVSDLGHSDVRAAISDVGFGCQCRMLRLGQVAVVQ